MRVRKVAKIVPQEPNQICLKKCISGGQIGADIAGLRAAKKSGFKTGGSIPQGFVTIAGTKPGYGWLYGLRDNSQNYKERTWKNVQQSTATIRLAVDFGTRGEVCTLNAIRAYRKPFLDVYMEKNWIKPVEETANWILESNITTLNIAGNAFPGLEEQIEKYLIDVFYLLLWGK